MFQHDQKKLIAIIIQNSINILISKDLVFFLGNEQRNEELKKKKKCIIRSIYILYEIK
jgi:calcineurin-like phosphoesterase family protein